MTRQSYATEIRIIRVMCTGRVDLAFVFRAFVKGADGVIVAGCWPGECHYVTEGNYDALGNILLGRRLLEQIGVSPQRLRLEWIATSEGARFAEVMNDFAEQVRALGPIGESGGVEPDGLARKLGAVRRLVPFLKLVEREKLRIPTRTEEAYRAYYEGDEVNRLFDGLVADRLAQSEMLMLLEESPLSIREISERLGRSPSVVSKYISDSSRVGAVRYDVDQKRYFLA